MYQMVMPRGELARMILSCDLDSWGDDEVQWSDEVARYNDEETEVEFED